MIGIDLSGRICLVIGGGRGIGASIVELLCRAGAFTAFTHTGNPAHAARVATLVSLLAREGGGARGEAIDARDGNATRALVDRLISGTPGTECRAQLPVELVVRGTCAPLRKRRKPR